MILKIETPPNAEFKVNTHRHRYTLCQNETHWVLAAKTTGGIVAEKGAGPFEALGAAVQALNGRYFARYRTVQSADRPGQRRLANSLARKGPNL